MAQNITEIVTVVAIALISIIFVVYLLILKKNGWLGEKSDFYRCPNQNCKKMFQKPIELKDLSETPPRTYPACPECGANLDAFFGFNHKKMLKIREKTLINHSKPEIKPIEKKPEVYSKPRIKPTEKKLKERRIYASKPNQSQCSILGEKTLASKPMVDQKKANVTNDSSCKYFFGYLASREKKGEIPDTCLECPKSLDCMLSNYKSEDTIVEIGKWYPVRA